MDESRIEKQVEYWSGEQGTSSDPPKPPVSSDADEEKEEVKQEVHRILEGLPAGGGGSSPSGHPLLSPDVEKVVEETQEGLDKIIPKDRASSSNNGGNMASLQTLGHQLSLLLQLKKDLEATRDDIAARRQSYEGTIANLLAAGMIVDYHNYMKDNAFNATNKAMKALYQHIQERDLVVVGNAIKQIQAQIEFTKKNGG